MAKVGYRAAELVSTIIAFLVLPSGVDDILILFKIIVYLGQEGGIDLVFRKHVVAVDAVDFDLVSDLERVGEDLRMVGEQGRHFLLALEVLLLGVVEARFLEYLLAGVQADQVVVGRTILFVHEMDVVGGHDLDSGLLG